MQHSGDADAGAEVPGIGGDLQRGLGRGLHQQAVDHGACSGRRRRAARPAACRRRGSRARAAARPRVLRATCARPPPGTEDNADHGNYCRRRSCGRRRRSHSAQHGRRAPRCGSARWPTSLSTGRGSRGRGWHHAKRHRGRGRYPQPPELDGACAGYLPAASCLASLRGALSRSSGLSIEVMSPVATRA